MKIKKCIGTTGSTLILTAFLSIVAVSAKADPVLFSSASGGNDHWYETIVSPGTSWADAQAAATAAGGYLVTITTQLEQDFVVGILISNPTPNTSPFFNSQVQNSYWTGGVADIMVLGSLTLGSPTTFHWNNGEPWTYTNSSFTSADADGLDRSANGGVVPAAAPIPAGFFVADFDEILASYVRISALGGLGRWSDHPGDGNLSLLGVDFDTGDITFQLQEINYIYGYVIEYDSRPAHASVPEPATLGLLSLGLAGLGFARRRRQVPSQL